MVHRCPETVLGASQSRLCFIPRVTYRRIYSKHFLSEHGRQLHGRIPAPPRSSGPVWSEFCSEKPNQGGISHTAQGDLFICFSPLLFQINIPGRKSRCIYLADFFCSVGGLNDIIFSGRELKVGLNPSASIFCFGYWSDGISLDFIFNISLIIFFSLLLLFSEEIRWEKGGGGVPAQRSPMQREMQRGGETVFYALIQRGCVGARRTGEEGTHRQTPPPHRVYGTTRQTQP